MPEALQEATGEPQTAENAPSGTQTPPEQDNGSESQPETFNREYVEKLRKEAAEHRVKSKRALRSSRWVSGPRACRSG